MIPFGLEGHSDADGRDLTIDAMKAAATRLRRSAVDVSAVRYNDRGWIIDGFLVRSEQFGVQGRVVPVRRRRRRLAGRWVGPWQELQAVSAALHEVRRSVGQ